MTLEDDCEALSSASRSVGAWMSKQPHVKEESITDWLLYDLSEKRKDIIYHAFSRHEESSLTGADWEWWFLFCQSSFKYRVQAKKLRTDKDNYPSVAYSNTNGLQIDMLVRDSRAANALPMYAFYTAPTGSETACRRGGADDYNGVFLAGASAIQTSFLDPGRRKITSADILKESVPFSCLACCPLVQNSGSHEDFLRHYFDRDFNYEGANQPLGLHEDVPGYVEALVQASREGDVPHWFEGEFRRDIADTKSILIYDLRNSNKG